VQRAFQIRVNGRIRARHVRVIGADGSMLGVMTLAEGLRAAMQAGRDLVEVNPKADPPVCKILNFSSYKYEGKKKAAEAKHPTVPTEPEDDE